MKKQIALIVSFVILVVTLLPLQGFAAELDESLLLAIERVKSIFDVPDSYDGFESYYSMSGESKVWNLNWYQKEGTGEGLSVSVDDKGTIKSYNISRDFEYPEQKRFPKYNKAQAKEIAAEFIQKVNPDAYKHVAYKDDGQNEINNYSYSLRFVRTENGIPFYNDYIRVSVNSETGDVMNYRLYWTDGLVFPDPKGAISVEEANAAYKEKLGLELVYQYKNDVDGIRIYAVYKPVYNNSSVAIDALTGEKVETGYGSIIIYDVEMTMKEAAMDRGGGINGSIVITPQEREEIDKLVGMINEGQAEAIARNAAFLGITDDYKVTNKTMSRYWPLKDEYIYQFNFRKEATDESTNDYRNVNVGINARTGSIISFYAYSGSTGEKKEPQYDRASAKALVEEFLKEHYSDYLAQTVYDELQDRDYELRYASSALKPSSYTFQYIRKVNGVKFPGNGITVRVNAVDKTVESFELTWFDVEFPAIDRVISPDKAYECALRDQGLELSYRLKNKPDAVSSAITSEKMALMIAAGEILPPAAGEQPEVALVYAFKNELPLFFDAFTGVRLDGSGEIYKEPVPISYTDIDGHYAEDRIMTLAQFGIGFEGSEFRPDESITQLDFLTLLSKVVDVYVPLLNAESTQKEIDEFYDRMQRAGIVKEGEKAPDAVVTMEESTKYFIRAMKVEKVAMLTDIFTCKFKDADEISEGLLGYVSIAHGMGIVAGDGNMNFNPKSSLTRANAAIEIYNYLSVR